MSSFLLNLLDGLVARLGTKDTLRVVVSDLGVVDVVKILIGLFLNPNLRLFVVVDSVVVDVDAILVVLLLVVDLINDVVVVEIVVVLEIVVAESVEVETGVLDTNNSLTGSFEAVVVVWMVGMKREGFPVCKAVVSDTTEILVTKF